MNNQSDELRKSTKLEDQETTTIPKAHYLEILSEIDRIRVLINNVKEGIVVYGPDLRYQVWNAYMEHLTGYKEEDIVGKHPDEMFPFFKSLGLSRNLHDILLGKSEGYSIEFGFTVPENNRKGQVEQINEPLFDSKGNIVGVFTSVRDITKQKWMENAFLQTNQLLTMFLKHSPIYAYIKEVTKEESRILIASDSFKQMPGIINGEVAGKTMNQIFQGELAQQITDDDLSVISTGNIVTKEEVLNGRKYLTIKFPIRQGKKNLLGGYAIDITDISKTQEDLKKTKELLLSIANGTSDIIYAKDKDGKYIFANNSLIEFFGASSQDDVLGRELCEFISINNESPLIGIEKDVMQRREALTIEEIIPDKDGEKKIFSVTKGPTYDNSGNVVGIFGISRDITAQKETEELTRLSQERLQMAQKMDALGTLAGGIAHDFNNILTPVMGYLDLLSHDSTLSVTQKSFLEKSIGAVKRASDVIRQFQYLSKNTASEKSSFDIYKVVNEVIVFLQISSDKIIEKVIEFKEGKYYIYGNEGEIHQILLNLALNSIKAIEEKGSNTGGIIKISANDYISKESDKISLPEGEYIHIIFEDNGVGMNEDVLKKAFNPLFTTRRKPGQTGKGLGLTMVYNIVSKHNGYINIESKEGLGTKVNMYLPKATKTNGDGINNECHTNNGSEMILVVDDDEDIRKFVKTVLEMYGYKVILAENGKEGLEKYVENKEGIDLVILDLVMPVMSGQDAFQSMLKIKSDVKVIISSGHNDKNNKDGILSNAYGFINKPYTIDDLLNPIRRLLNNNKS